MSLCVESNGSTNPFTAIMAAWESNNVWEVTPHGGSRASEAAGIDPRQVIMAMIDPLNCFLGSPLASGLSFEVISE